MVRSLWTWRVLHPVRVARAFLPHFLPLTLRRFIFAPLAKPGWGDPAEWERDLRAVPVPPAIQGGALPMVSICIVAYQNEQLTRLCVESIFRLTTYEHFEVVVVDNASTDGTAEWLRSEQRVRALFMPINVGFAAACNEAVRSTSAPIVAILNNDVVVTPHWLELLVAQLIEADDIAMVGPVTNACGNEARVRAGYQGLSSMLRAAAGVRQRHADAAFEIPVLELFCAVLRRATWADVGPLDDRFGKGLFEDDDYARRLRKRHLRLVCREDVFVHHWGRAALRLLGEEEHRLYEHNQRLFRSKWSNEPD